MATVNNSLPHIQRTAHEPRESGIERVRLSQIRQVNEKVRILRLDNVDETRAIPFKPGQWLDVLIPGMRQAGGFTITSTPFQARPSSNGKPYVELAVQRSRNPPARWLWLPEDEILNTELMVRVGGSFFWPPQKLNEHEIDRLVLIAGGVGINPLISIFTYLIHIPAHMRPQEVHFVYASKASPDLDAQKILFLPRLLDLVGMAADPHNVTLSVYLTGTGTDDGGFIEGSGFPTRTFARRLQEFDVQRALDGFRDNKGTSRSKTIVYVCGPPQMTDELVALAAKQEGMSADRVLCEKWW